MADWEYPALGFDPLPGEPMTILALRDDARAYGQRMTEEAGRLRRLARPVDWAGQAADAYSAGLDHLPRDLQRCGEAFLDLAGVLERYHERSVDARRERRKHMLVLILGALVVLAAACTSSSGGSSKVREDLTIDEAEAQLKKIVLDTAEAAGPGLPHPVFEDIGPTGCEDSETSPHVFSTWSVDVVLEDGREPAELLPAVEAHWKARGYDIDRHRLEDPEPELIGHTQGFAVTALAVPDAGRLNIGGDTPCVPNPERDEK